MCQRKWGRFLRSSARIREPKPEPRGGPLSGLAAQRAATLGDGFGGMALATYVKVTLSKQVR